MTRNAFTPVAYSAATRRSMARLVRQLDLTQRYLDGHVDMASPFVQEQHVRASSLAFALYVTAEEHRQWADVETYQARWSSHYRTARHMAA